MEPQQQRYKESTCYVYAENHTHMYTPENTFYMFFEMGWVRSNRVLPKAGKQSAGCASSILLF
jgi:hypothetical protein